jgi:D-glycero-alpha-D-manno-heptose-7-phosphate kinase
VFNIAVSPVVEVQMHVLERSDSRARVTLHAENYGETYTLTMPPPEYGKHPVLEAAFDFMRIPEDVCVEVSVFSEAPGGCSTGTSAAVSVALLAALDQLSPGRMTPHEIARAAHRVESDLLKQQSGIQDQIASAYGGINYIDMYEYPFATVSQMRLPDATFWELENRLSLVYVGCSHSSSATHEMVIRSLQESGPDAPALRPLRATAEQAKNALFAGDFDALGRSMIANTDAQGELHPDLIGTRHAEIIDIAREHGAIGWKVNGAGGEGGSVTLLSGLARQQRRMMLRAIAAANPEYQNIPISISRRGVRTWTS